MKTASIKEIKQAIQLLDAKSLQELCLRMVRYKKENKELLTYLLFEAQDENAFVEGLKSEIDFQMAEVRKSNLYLTKKSLRKVLRFMDRYIRFSGNKETEATVRIFFCKKIKEKGIPVHRSKVLGNLYEGQLKKIDAAISKLHEDLQYDLKCLKEDSDL